LQLGLEPVLAVDTDPIALAVYEKNFNPKISISDGLESFIDSDFGTKTSKTERHFIRRVGNIDLLLAGPPCQGHSDLNNHTRRNDPRNLLLLKVARFAELFSPENILIENVQGIRHDRRGVLYKAERQLTALGYHVESFLLDAASVGVSQKRRRCFLVASRRPISNPEEMLAAHSAQPRSFDWACGDLRYNAEDVFNSSAKVSEENQRRINYLFKHKLYELPDSQRPDCHRLRPHGYHSVYGRIYPDRPAPTITTGFGSSGQGRFTHPYEERTLTPHEAARLQFFPDFFQFAAQGRKALQRLIGNAVPPKLAFPVVLELLKHA